MKQKAAFQYFPQYGFVVLFGKLIWLPHFPRMRAFGAMVRGLFPKAWSAHFYCCDTQRFHSGVVVFSLNDFHFRSVWQELARASDGTEVRQIPVLTAIRLHLTGQSKWRST